MEESEECSTFGDLRIHEGPTALTSKQDPGDRCLFMVAGAILQWFYQKDDLFREKTMFSYVFHLFPRKSDVSSRSL